MKRLFSVAMVFLLCLVLAVPALASERYEFYHAPAVLPDFEFPRTSDCFISESVLVSGVYTLTFVYDDVTYVSEPFDLSLVPFEDETFPEDSPDVFVADVYILVPDLGVRHVAFSAVSGYGSSLGFVTDEGTVSLPDFGLQSLILNSVSSGLDSIITGDVLRGSLDQVVSLLPVVLAVLVGFVGFRKAIAWLQGVFHGA